MQKTDPTGPNTAVVQELARKLSETEVTAATSPTAHVRKPSSLFTSSTISSSSSSSSPPLPPLTRAPSSKKGPPPVRYDLVEAGHRRRESSQNAPKTPSSPSKPPPPPTPPRHPTGSVIQKSDQKSDETPSSSSSSSVIKPPPPPRRPTSLAISTKKSDQAPEPKSPKTNSVAIRSLKLEDAIELKMVEATLNMTPFVSFSDCDNVIGHLSSSKMQFPVVKFISITNQGNHVTKIDVLKNFLACFPNLSGISFEIEDKNPTVAAIISFVAEKVPTYAIKCGATTYESKKSS